MSLEEMTSNVYFVFIPVSKVNHLILRENSNSVWSVIQIFSETFPLIFVKLICIYIFSKALVNI